MESVEEAPPTHRWVYGKLSLTALFWGGTFIAGRVAATDVGPFTGAFLRFLLASGILVVFAARTERARLHIPTREVPRLALLGLFGTVFYNVLFFKGLQTVSAGRASVIVALNPAFIALFASLLLGERLTLRRVTGILFSLGGAVVVISRGEPMALIQGGVTSGDLCMLGCVGSWVSYTLLGKRAMDRLTPLTVVTGSAVIGTLGLLGPALYEGLLRQLPHFSATVWIATGYLAVLGTVFGFVWFYEGVRELGPARAGVFINLVPASSVVLGALLLREKLTSSLLSGLFLVTLGVFLTNWTSGGIPGFRPTSRCRAAR